MKIFGILFLVAFTLLSCKKEQPDMSVLNQGCNCASEVSADFLMEEMTTGNVNFAKYTETDSIFGGKNVEFSAKLDNAEYTWYVGAEILDTKSFKRFFGTSLAGSQIPITLVVKKQPNKICFPNDDGYDSITKLLTVTNYPIWDPANNQVTLGILEGVYRVKSDHLLDSFDISIDQVMHPTWQTDRTNIYNYDGFGSNCELNIFSSGNNYRQLFFEEGTAVLSCDDLQGDLLVRNTNSVVFNLRFTISGSPNIEFERIYKGRKL